MSDVKSARKALTSKPKTAVKPRAVLSTSSTLLNLALSDSPYAGITKGSYVHLAGDSDSGKSFLARGILAEASINPVFDNYDLIYDDPEYGTALMDIRRLFGIKLARRVIERHSESVEEFYDTTDEDCKSDRPFIKILDSMDALTAKSDRDYIQKNAVARRRAKKSGKEVKEVGSYSTGKPKQNAERLRLLANVVLPKTKSILIIISQLKDKIGGMEVNMLKGDNKKYVAGGLALKYYAHQQIWTGTIKPIREEILNRNRELGILTKMKVKKNRLTGKKRDVNIPIYHSAGIDDLGSCIDYLIEEGHWQGTENQVIAPEFDFPKGSKEELIKAIEYGDLEDKLRQLVAATWQTIEDACKVERKRRYA